MLILVVTGSGISLQLFKPQNKVLLRLLQTHTVIQLAQRPESLGRDIFGGIVLSGHGSSLSEILLVLKRLLYIVYKKYLSCLLLANGNV